MYKLNLTRHFVASAFIDLRKALDTVDHNITLKLEYKRSNRKTLRKRDCKELAFICRLQKAIC